MSSPCIDYRHNMENRACGLLIHGPSAGARMACATVLRSWRKAGSFGPANPTRARWFLWHISRTGYPVKP